MLGIRGIILLVGGVGGTASASYAVAKFRDTPVTDEAVAKYIKATKTLRKVAPGMASQLSTGASLSGGKEGFATIERAITDAGFKDYAEFVTINGKIALSFSAIQGRRAVDSFGGDMAKGQGQIAAALNGELVRAEPALRREGAGHGHEDGRSGLDRGGREAPRRARSRVHRPLVNRGTHYPFTRLTFRGVGLGVVNIAQASGAQPSLEPLIWQL
jgi:hypothetical protein